MYYLYILKNSKGLFYTGYSSNLKARFKEHNSDNVTNKKSFTYRNKPWKLIYYEAYSKESKARERERKLKHFGNSFSHLKNRIM